MLFRSLPLTFERRIPLELEGERQARVAHAEPAVLWMPYGGARAKPLTGSYALGVEPWTSMFNLERAVEAGEAIELAPGARLETEVVARVTAR